MGDCQIQLPVEDWIGSRNWFASELNCLLNGKTLATLATAGLSSTAGLSTIAAYDNNI